MLLLRVLNRLFHGPAWLTFLVMGAATGGAGLCSYNLYEMFRANVDLINRFGAMAIADGGLLQLVELIAWGYLALGCYVIFKGCLDGLLAKIHAARGSR